MIDITSVGEDINIFDTQTSKAGNILSVQLGSLQYAQDLGIDLAYFLRDDVAFQNESFRAYLVEVLANSGINVSSVVTVIESLYQQYTISISPEETSTGLVAR